MKKILITGAAGFIGKRLSSKLQENGNDITKIIRGIRLDEGSRHTVSVGDINGETDWQFAMQGGDVVVHLAARVHVMQDSSDDPLTEFRRINVAGTLNLARQAAAAGVKRFIYMSSIKVNGEATYESPFRPEDKPNPVDPYGQSKLEAERGLWKLAKETGMEVVIIRPPLVYGPGVKANFLNMMRWLHRGVPLPLGAIDNRRSLVALDNLVDLIMTCIDQPAAANQTFLAGDGEDLSTSELLRRMGKAFGRPARLLPVPGWLLKTLLNLIGKSAIAQRLYGSLQVDISKAQDMLGWIPPQSMDEALKLTAEWYKRSAEHLHARNER